jgi:uncharacterized protein YndB with AHSA1/START domain
VSTTAYVDMKARRTSASRRIKATPEAIFEILTDPAKHPLIDGSGTVQTVGESPGKLQMGSKFGMSMKLKLIPYRVRSTVVEFDENRLIAWHHLGKHRWRYELEPIEEGTLVTETFDWSTSLAPRALELAGYPKTHLTNIEQSLERLAELVEE